MDQFETIWRLLATGLAVWRLSRVLFGDTRSARKGNPQKEQGAVSFWAARAADLACWISVLLSSQAAVWVACGSAGVFVSWLSLAGMSRLFERESWAMAQSGDTSCVTGVDGMQVHHG